MKPYTTFFLALWVLVAAGCSTPQARLTSFPTDTSDFALPQQEIRQKHSDIDRYDGPGLFRPVWDMPPVEDINSKWGAPKEKRPSWWNLYGPAVLAAFGMPPVWIVSGTVMMIGMHPTAVHTWEKGEYKIEAVVDYPVAKDYEPHLMYWRWYHVATAADDKDRATVAKSGEATRQ